MSFIKKTFYFFSFLVIALIPLYAKEDFRVESQPTAVTVGQTLSYQAVLRQKEDGYVYLDVSNDWITKLVPLLDLEGELRQLPTSSRSIGAHISVFYENEHITPTELGMTFQFELQEIRSFMMSTRDGLKKLWVVGLHSPELEQLREKYGCAPKLNGHEFHITLGKQMPTAPQNWQAVEEISPLEFEETPTLGLSHIGDFFTVDQEELLLTVEKVDRVGQLCLKGNGFVYLDVDNSYVDKTISNLPLAGAFSPTSTKPKSMGAHISVIYEDEMIGHQIWNLKEAGQWFTFQVKELRYVDRKVPGGKKRLWLWAVDAPSLERLRMQYGLKPKLQGHDFHITIGNEELEEQALPQAA